MNVKKHAKSFAKTAGFIFILTTVFTFLSRRSDKNRRLGMDDYDKLMASLSEEEKMKLYEDIVCFYHDNGVHCKHCRMPVPDLSYCSNCAEVMEPLPFSEITQ
jgi:hypothetical protein